MASCSPHSKARRRPPVARGLLAALVLLNAGAFVGTKLRAASNGGVTSGTAVALGRPPRRAGASGAAVRRVLAHAEPEVWASGGSSASRPDLSANVSR
jgi:hypothetical protein